jgi:L-lactate dehydrogenase complex protein LldG
VSGGREIVLGRVRAALADHEPVVDIPRAYRRSGSLPPADVVARFVERVADYGARVVSAADVPRLLAGSTLGVAPDLPPHLRPAGMTIVEDDGLEPTALDALDGALTTCAVACADTGTIALTGGPGEGRRALTLVPDLHVCVVRADQVVETVPELFARLEPIARTGRPIVLVSGPSATSDIELERVEGVHGPRRLVVVLEP